MKRIALIGNPNCGKSSVFNALTGMHQRTGNYSGITVESTLGRYEWQGDAVELVDLPGTYSLYPSSKDELVVSEELLSAERSGGIDAVVYVSDVNMLEKELLLLTQIMDLEFPVVLVLNMADLQPPERIERIKKKIQNEFGIRVVEISARKKTNLPDLKDEIQSMVRDDRSGMKFTDLEEHQQQISNSVSDIFPDLNDYGRLLMAHHYGKYNFVRPEQRAALSKVLAPLNFDSLTEQMEETMCRYEKLTPVIREANLQLDKQHTQRSKKIDRILVHPFAGPVIFLALMLLVFQAVFTWSQYPMAGIEWIFANLSELCSQHIKLPWLADLLSNGILAGLGAILVFAPQIAILFFLLAILEQSGYMARVVYLFDPLMKRVGLSGRSMVALFSGAACAVPAIMSTRTIRDPKERLNTILVTPLISCSARLPVYILLIGMLVPAGAYAGIFNKQASIFILLYLISISSTFVMAYIFKKMLGSSKSGMLLLDLPVYRQPVWRDVFMTVWTKVKTFAWEAGRIIFVLSIVIWIASSYGPPAKMKAAIASVEQTAITAQLSESELSGMKSSTKLENSYAGHLGKWIEPAIRPLGYDWKIGIGLISAFAAREVFVGTLATIYSVGDDSNVGLQQKMQSATFSDNGKPVFSFATIISLLLFFLFSMQCMSTLAIVKKETKTWKWPMFQMVYMTVLAVGASLLAYQLLS